MSTDHKHVRIKDVMKTTFTLIDGKATIYDALVLMKKNRTSMLVVDKRHADDEYGLLLASDIARQVLACDRSSKRINVYEVMEKPAVYVEPEMDIRYCSRLFAQFDLVRALVIDENRQVQGTVGPNALVLDGMFELEVDNAAG
ncbi:MAG: CBS domain-containing protein [Chromatiales bacterium]|nr:CBS domain-containing protein [Chromatiales bacterium]